MIVSPGVWNAWDWERLLRLTAARDALVGHGQSGGSFVRASMVPVASGDIFITLAEGESHQRPIQGVRIVHKKGRRFADSPWDQQHVRALLSELSKRQRAIEAEWSEHQRVVEAEFRQRKLLDEGAVASDDAAPDPIPVSADQGSNPIPEAAPEGSAPESMPPGSSAAKAPLNVENMNLAELTLLRDRLAALVLEAEAAARVRRLAAAQIRKHLAGTPR
jgi:hypothetical protein